MAQAIDIKKILARLRTYPIALSAGALALIFAALIFVRGSNIDALKIELDSKESEWKRISGNLKRARDLEQHLAAITAMEEDVSARLMNPEQRALNYDYFFSLEDVSGVKLVSLNQGGVIDTKKSSLPGIEEFKKYQLIGYTLSIEGEFDDILRFLTALSNGRYLTRVSSFSIARAQQRSSDVLSINLQMQVLGIPHES